MVKMSRIGAKQIKIPEGVDVRIEGQTVAVKGPKGELEMKMRKPVAAEVEDGILAFKRSGDTKEIKSLHGLYRSKADSMIAGVTNGYTKELEIKGIGYRAQMEGNNLVMQIGFSHPVKIAPPEGITIIVTDSTKIRVEGIDKQLVGQVAADIREKRKVEPYKGKGIRYIGEQVRRKAGKAGKGAIAA